MAGNKAWTPSDRTGGPLDDIFRLLRTLFSDASVSRLVGTFPADDDNVFWVNRADVEVQIDMGDGGAGPFIVESDAPGSRFATDDPVAAAEGISRMLEAVGEG